MKGEVPLLVTVLLLAAALAGCLGAPSGGNGSEAEPSGEETGGDGGPGDPSTGEGSDAEGRPVHEAATRWVREQWDDRSRVLLYDDTVDESAVLTTPGGCFFCSSDPVEIPEGSTILPGTDEIEVELDWEDPETATSMEVSFRWDPPVGDDGSESRTEPGNITVPVGSGQADGPFANRTDWYFGVDAHGDPAGSHEGFEVDVTMTLVREGPVPAIPEPPDPWNGTETIALVENASRSRVAAIHSPVTGAYGGSSGIAICGGPCGFSWSVADDALVPADADRVRAVLTWDWSAPTKPVLHRSVEGDTEPMEVVDDAEDRRVFEVEVTDELADSPFRSRSEWSFFATLHTEGQDVGAASGSVTLTASAQRNATASSTY